MRKLIFLFLICIAFSSESDGLSVNVICRFNGKGIEVDGKVLEEALKSLGCTVNRYREKDTAGIAFADINIFCEQIIPHFLSQARQNWFIPNPEISKSGQQFIDSIDLFLCRTKEIERIFERIGKNTYFIGFTTPEACRPTVEKDFSAFIHVGGASPFKGTQPVVYAWKRNPSFPLLTIVSTLEPIKELPINLEWIGKRLPLEELRQRQNQCGIHLCLSDTEGYGHYLMEAMSCGAVVMTTDAPPMNEFIQDSRFLVPYSYTKDKGLATRYFVTPEAIEVKVNEIFNLNGLKRSRELM